MLWLTREMWTYGHIRVHREVTLASPKFNPCIQRKTNQEESLQNNTENPQTSHQNLSSCTRKEHLGKPVLTNHNHQLCLLPPSRASVPGAAALGVQPQGHQSKVSCMCLNRRVSSSPPALHSALGFSRHHTRFFSALPCTQAGSTWATYSAGHRNHAVRYTHTPEEYQIMLAQRTLTVPP